MLRLQRHELTAVVPSLPPVARTGWNENSYIVVAQAPRAGVRVAVGLPFVPDLGMWSVGAAYGAITNRRRRLRLLVTIRDGDSIDADQRPFSQGILVVRVDHAPGSRVRAGTGVAITVKRFRS